MAPEVVLGIDLGTTATKVVAAGPDGRPSAMTQRRYPLHIGPHGEVTQDPDVVAEAAEQAVAQCARECAAAGAQVVGISFSAAMHTLLALDAAGRPLTEALTWADNRARGTVRRYLRPDDGVAATLHQATGTPIHPMSPLMKLVWFAEHEPRIHRVAAHWVGLKDYVLHRMTGLLATDHSTASGTGLLDVRRLDWHRPALELAGITTDRLPELLPPTEAVPLSSTMAGLPSGLPVVVGAGDGPLANVGAGAIGPGIAAVSLGTSGALRVTRDVPMTDERGQMFCYVLAEGRWVVGEAVSNGGVVGDWAAELFGVPVAELLAEAEDADTDGLLALPYLLAERSGRGPLDPGAVLLGLRLEHGRAAVARAVVEGVAQRLALVLDAVLAAGVAVEHVRATGGAFRSALWASVLAAALDRPVELTEDEGGSGLGAALLGWRAFGELSSLASAADLVKPTKTIFPEPRLRDRLVGQRVLVERASQAFERVSADLAGWDG